MEQTQFEVNDWLPTTVKEMKARGWDDVDVVLFSGDAYIDHPSFGGAVVGRIFEREGLRVAIVPQPNWNDDLRDFKKFGEPNLFFAISGGSMDSMVNHYTAARRRRSDDAYTPGGRAGARPDYASVVYSNILRKLYPETPIVVGGIEASLRRLTHYDYWKDELKPGILADMDADLLFYGMGEKSLVDFVRLAKKGVPVKSITTIPQTAFIVPKDERFGTNKKWEQKALFSHEECLNDKLKYAQNFKHIETESNRWDARLLTQNVGDTTIVVNPPYPPLSEKDLDASFDLPFTRLPHPKYKGKAIPAYDMIRHSVNIHRGCFGGCAFCTISAHQGKFITSRSEKSILKEVKQVTQMPDFKGTLSDVGGPSANMYRMHGKDLSICKKCSRPSCVHPNVCKNLNNDHRPLTALYKKVKAVEGIKHAFIGSGIRYDMVLHKSGDTTVDEGNLEYMKEVIRHHVSGRLKVAPEHTSDEVLNLMRKPSFDLFDKLRTLFADTNKEANLNQQLIPYFISSHPGCKEEDMAELAAKTKKMDFRLEQVQDFTPTPMTVATVMYYSGVHPYTLKPVEVAKTKNDKQAQRSFFFWYKQEFRNQIKATLKKMGRKDLIEEIFARDESRTTSSHSTPKPKKQDKRAGHSSKHSGENHSESRKKSFSKQKRRR